MLLEKMTVDDYNAVVQSKVQGTWNLHNHLPKDMDFFVMLSSVSGIIGNTTQAAYAAGNTFMDAFAAFRNAQGLPAVTLDLGAISGVGYLAADENKELLESMKRQGFNSTDEKLLMALIQSAIVNPHRQGESSQTVTGLGTWKRGQSLPAFDAPMFAHFRRLSPDPDENGSVSKESEGVESVKAALRSCSALDEAAGVICTALIGYLAARSGIPAENFSSERTITEYGVDSIVAVELRNWIAHEMDSTVPILELLANNSLLQLSAKIASRSKSVKVEAEES
jgi:KR domain/Phosphopantetheine attachment site